LQAIVSTLNYLLLINLKKQTCKILEGHRGRYYGISWDANSTLILTHSSHNKNGTQGYLSFGNQAKLIELSNPHQTLWLPDNKIAIANTGKNCLTLFDPSSNEYKDHYFNEVTADHNAAGETCGDHFNSLFYKNDRLFVLAHHFYKTSYVLELAYPSCEILKKQEVMFRSGMRNIWVDENNNIFSSHSESGSLIEITSGNTLWNNGTPRLYQKGLAVTKDYFIVGDGQRGTYEERMRMQTAVWLIDKKNYSSVDYIPFGPFGQIQEIRIIDEPDFAHHGMIFNNKEYFKQEDYLTRCRRKKMNFANDPLAKFIYIAGCLRLNDEDWYTPLNSNQKELTIAVARNQPSKNFMASLKYKFSDAQNEMQHLSLIVGYKGMYDQNMMALFLHYVNRETCHLYLMKHIDNAWQPPELLIEKINFEGDLKVKKRKNSLTIYCNQHKPISKSFTPQELTGKIGIRCIGSQFKDFTCKNIW
jgi:hypothetical protein